MFVLELRVLPVLRRSPEGSGAPMDFADEKRIQIIGGKGKGKESGPHLKGMRQDRIA